MTKRLIILLASLVLVVPFVFYGCGGSDGATGATGATGPAGPAGPAGDNGTVTNTDESCMVCHTTGRIADISDSATTGMHYQAKYNYPSLAIDNLSVDNNAGAPVAHFRVTSGGAAVTTLTATAFRFYIADLVPAGTITDVNTDYFERWASERSGTGYIFGTFDNTNAASGNYTYTFATAFGSAAALDNAAEFSSSHIQRLVIRASLTNYNGTAGILDFNIPADGANTTGLTYNARQFVTVNACKNCHGPLMAGTAHGSSYIDTRVCVICHTPIGAATGTEMVELEAWFGSLIHKLHSAKEVAGFPTRIGGKGYTAVTYPQDIRNCTTCHTNSGLSLGLGDKVDNWKSHPTTAMCKTCHTGFPTGHPAAVQPDSACATCHPATGHVAPTLGASVTEAHDTSPSAVLHPNTKNVPEFNVTLALTAPANGTHYVANENVTATVTLKKYSDNTAVAGTVYTAAKDNTGITGGGLSTASLYVYGPRALPKPILGKQATTMFVSTTDNNVKTDATGFKYLVKIPTGLTSGTYMVRVRIGDYGRINDNNYVVESIAFQNIQIGSATVTKKVSGDGCVDCHGTASAPFHDARHIVVFNTDECVSCHDYSGGHADILSNRVHAVHSSNNWGDLLVVDWSDVTYPQNSYPSSATGTVTPGYDRCTTCHDSGNTSYRSTVVKASCIGCHGDDPGPLGGGATNHMNQSGGTFVDLTP